MKRIPERILDPEFRFEEPGGRSQIVTVYHITRVIAKLTKDVTPNDGWIFGSHHTQTAHSWLATRNTPYVIEVLPRAIVADPFIVDISAATIWYDTYQKDDDVTSDFGPNELERQVTQLLAVIEGVEPFLTPY